MPGRFGKWFGWSFSHKKKGQAQVDARGVLSPGRVFSQGLWPWAWDRAIGRACRQGGNKCVRPHGIGLGARRSGPGPDAGMVAASGVGRRHVAAASVPMFPWQMGRDGGNPVPVHKPWRLHMKEACEGQWREFVPAFWMLFLLVEL